MTDQVVHCAAAHYVEGPDWQPTTLCTVTDRADITQEDESVVTCPKCLLILAALTERRLRGWVTLDAPPEDL